MVTLIVIGEYRKEWSSGNIHHGQARKNFSADAGGLRRKCSPRLTDADVDDGLIVGLIPPHGQIPLILVPRIPHMGSNTLSSRPVQ